ncbi:metal ABC transporter ATP-binding protein [Candidatus Protochlamydia sp. W-9]|uniref:metal ABC transporter ATP-binding protein n=1 Tax=Candidatus Protochlamydia sp. W-9 TaxID=1785087 RepID=UPI00096A635A|nr:ABC transporter ATP-binding protein [Candidatus Protochlamydia sp. W-9]
MLPIIKVDHLTFCYDNSTILSDISFEVNPGEFIGIIGPNGGGKTTLLKLIMGFLKPENGKIEVFGKNPIAQSFQQLAYVPQSIRFDREFPISVFEVVLSGLLSQLPWYGHFSKKAKLAAYEALEKVGLKEFSRESFGTLSGGQTQRVLIARALVSKPRLLLLDEPTASVDSRAEADIYALLKELKGSMTILMVTHDLQAAIGQVERLLCIQRYVFSLQPEEVCEHFTVGLYHTPLIPTKQTSTFF